MLEYIIELPIFMVILGFFCIEYCFFFICEFFGHKGASFFVEVNIDIVIIAAFGLFVHFHGLDFLMRSITDLSKT